MDALNDDVLSVILSYVDKPWYRNSIALVSKRFLRLERLTRCFLSVQEPDFLDKLLTRFPNLLQLELNLWKTVNNTHLEIVSRTCPRIEVLNLKLPDDFIDLRLLQLALADDDSVDHVDVLEDNVDDIGVTAIAKGCPKLRIVSLRYRKGVGNLAVISLVNSAKNLTNLDLGWCELVTDDALKAIGESKSIMSLNLQGCSKITDCGLASLAKGIVSKNLKTLVIAECDRITDAGVSLLQNMRCLEVLDIMARCGFSRVTDVGCVAIATKIGRTLTDLNLSRLPITNDTIIAFARNCLKLTSMDLTGCELLTGVGIRALSNHPSLRFLYLTDCNIDAKDVEHMVLRLPCLRRISMNGMLRISMPKSVENNIRRCCELSWARYRDFRDGYLG